MVKASVAITSKREAMARLNELDAVFDSIFKNARAVNGQVLGITSHDIHVYYNNRARFLKTKGTPLKAEKELKK